MSSKNCPECKASPGQLHQRGCDVELCPYCGCQLISCGCEDSRSATDWPPNDDRIPWTGRWPGEEEAAAMGLFAKMVPGKGWVPCGREEPGAELGLNALASKCKWNRTTKRWITRLTRISMC